MNPRTKTTIIDTLVIFLFFWISLFVGKALIYKGTCTFLWTTKCSLPSYLFGNLQFGGNAFADILWGALTLFIDFFGNWRAVVIFIILCVLYFLFHKKLFKPNLTNPN